MGWFKFRKETDNKDNANERIEVEDMLDQDYTCKEIAEQMNISLQQVYLYKQNKERREARKGIVKKPELQTDSPEIKQLQVKIKEAELQDQLNKVEHNASMRNFERMSIMQNMFGVEGGEVEGGGGMSPESLLMSLLLNANKGQTTPQTPQVEQYVSPKQEKPLETPEIKPPQNVRQLIDALKGGFIPNDIAIKKAVEYGLTEAEAEALLKALKKTK